MKNAVIVILMVAVAFLFYQNKTMKNDYAQTQKSLQTTQEVLNQVQVTLSQKTPVPSNVQAMEKTSGGGSSTNSTLAANTAPSISNALTTEQNRLAELIQDRQQIQQQIQNLTPQNLNSMIQQKQADLNALQNQLKGYQSNERTVELNVNTALQFQRTLSQQTQQLLNTRIRNQENAIRITRRELTLAQRMTDLNQNDRVANLQNQLTQQQNDLQGLINQKQEASSDAVQNTSNLGDQATTAKIMTAQTQTAIQNQMSLIQQDINSLNNQKAQAQSSVGVYKQELSQLNEEIKQQQKTVNQLKKR